MFVKNLVTAGVPTMTVSISHESTTLYTGAIADTPFYLLNEKVLEIGIFGGNLTVKI
jgi:hypothetical protein